LGIWDHAGFPSPPHAPCLFPHLSPLSHSRRYWLPPVIGQPWPSPFSRARSATEARAAAAPAQAKPSAATAVGKDESEALPIRLEVILPPDQPRHSCSPLLSILLHPSSPACGVSITNTDVLWYIIFRLQRWLLLGIDLLYSLRAKGHNI
jgi:hypothetical protein